MSGLRLAILCELAADRLEAALLAEALHLPRIVPPIPAEFSHLLVLTAERLELREIGPEAPGPVYADFVAGAVAHRQRFGGGRNQPLARAVGLRGESPLSVVDATAGLGRDGFVLASLGCTVRLIERCPVIAALLRDGVRRANADASQGPWVRERLSVTLADGINYLREQSDTLRPDVVYLDPMYPKRPKTALPAKELRLLRHVAGDDDDAPDLLAAALACARRRVVVKRPRRAPALIGPPPSFQITAPHTRFDVYRTFAQSNGQAG